MHEEFAPEFLSDEFLFGDPGEETDADTETSEEEEETPEVEAEEEEL